MPGAKRPPSSEAEVAWGKVNQPIAPEVFDRLLDRVCDHLRGREVFVMDAFAGADPTHRLPVRVVCERAYHALFSRQLFINPARDELAGHRPEFTIIAAPDFQADPEWKKVAAESQVDGRIVSNVVSVFMDAADYSPIK